MNKYVRSYPNLGHDTKHSTHYHFNIDWKVMLIALVVGLGLIGVWKIANHDYCPTYYGTQCLINK